MKTAVSIPDGVFKKAEQLARKRKMSRSELYATALEQFLARDQENEITRKLNEVYAKEDSRLDPVLESAALEVLNREEW
jgi:predicted transcriptional regulator